MQRPLLALLPVVLLSCGDEGSTAIEETSSADTLAASTASAVDLGPHDLPLMITLPDPGTLSGTQPEMGWHEEEGWFFVKAGDHFSLQITEEPGDKPRLKGDLERDLLRKHTIITDAADLVVYQSEFPDDPDLVFVHFYQVIRAGDRSFVVQSDPEGKFNEADVERMRTAVSPKTAG